MPVFTCSVEVAGMTFQGEAAKSKKQAEKNAAMVAWSALKQRMFMHIAHVISTAMYQILGLVMLCPFLIVHLDTRFLYRVHNCIES